MRFRMDTFFFVEWEAGRKKIWECRVQMALIGKVKNEVTSIWIISPKCFLSKMRFYTFNYPENCFKFYFMTQVQIWAKLFTDGGQTNQE